MEPDHAVQDSETTPQTPGPILRRCREFHNISFETAAETTKIGKNYLRALEDDRHSDFASPAYLKGFLRIYANYLGLNADDLVRMLELEPPDDAATSTAQQDTHPESSRFTWQRLVLPTILLAVIVVLALLIRSNDQAPVPKPPPAPTPAAAVQPPRSSAQQQPGISGTTAIDALTPAAPTQVQQSGVTLRIKALRKSSLVVTMDEATTQTYELTAGDLIEWRADRLISLELGDPAGVELELNGKPFKPAQQPGRGATLNLDTNGIRP